MSVTVSSFGTTKFGEKASLYTITKGQGISACVTDYGAALQSLLVPNKQGGRSDVVLGFDDVSGYEAQDAYIGATVGRMANRVGGASFRLGAQVYQLCRNDGENSLHGGARGFDKYIWQADLGEDFVRFSRLSPDGEEGYPGNLHVSVTYSLSPDMGLEIAYRAVSDKDTVVSLTNHSYFNLNSSGPVLDQELMINAQRFTPLGPGTMPNGKICPVEGSPMDFRQFKPIGRDIDADDPQIKAGGGYDHNFVLSGPLAAVARCKETGIEMRCYTELPGMQLYTANFLGQFPGKYGLTGPRHAFCLETQLYPNAMNCYGFPSPVLRAGQVMSHKTQYKFSLFEV